jgi:hypothetical protein
MSERIPQAIAKLVLLKAYQSSDHVTPATGQTIAVVISQNGGAFANPSAGSVSGTEIGYGWYYLILSTTDTGTLGPLIVRGTADGVDDVEITFDVAGQVDADGYPIVSPTNILANTSYPLATDIYGNVSLSSIAAGSINLETLSGQVRLALFPSFVGAGTTTPATAGVYIAQGNWGAQIVWQNTTTGGYLWTDGTYWYVASSYVSLPANYWKTAANAGPQGPYTGVGTTTGTPSIEAVGNAMLMANQPVYAPAKAGNQMDLVNAPNATAVSDITSGLATAAELASLQSHGDSQWKTATGFAVPGSQMDFVNAPNTTAVAAIQSGLATSANATALLSAVNNLNNLSALANFFIAGVLVRPASGSIAYPLAVVVRDSEGLVVDLDSSPTITATNAAGTNRSSNLSAVTHASTGVYTGTYTVNSTDADEGLSFVATGTVSSVARRADSTATVASADSLAALAAIQAQTDLIGTNAMDSPNAVTAQTAAQAAATQATTAATESTTAAGNTATLLTNLATVEGHAANADAQSATAATQAASAATSAAQAATQAASAATALGTAGSGLTNLPPVSLTSAYNLYLADINFTKNSTTSTDEYTVVWSKNGIALTSGVTAAAIQVNNQDGSTLLTQTTMVGPNNGIFYHNETTSRTTAGAPVDVVVTATIDGTTRTFSKTVGRDA